MSRSISGLGIDMGPPSAATSGNRQRPSTMDAAPQEFTASLNQYNNLRRQSFLPVRRPTTSSTTSDRKVRIASGEPGVLGLGLADDTGSDCSSNHSRGSSGSKRYLSGPMNRNQRLGAAVAGMSDQAWDCNNSSPSDVYSSEASPETESSATSYSSGAQSGGSNLKRNVTIRKQRSQPNLSRASTLVRTENVTAAPSTATATAGLGRSKSSLSLSSHYKANSGSEAGSTSLGRSNEIPRSGSRASTSQRGRGRGSVRGHARSATWDPRSTHAASNVKAGGEAALVPDGFGGYVEAERAAYQAKPPTEVSFRGSPVEEHAAGRTRAPQRPSSSHANVPTTRSGPPRPSISALKVGSFYGPDGSETARLDGEGRLSRIGNSRPSSSAGASNSQSRASHQPSSSQRSQSQSRPRLQFMSSPTKQTGEEAPMSEVNQPAASQQQGKGLHKSMSQVSMRSERGWKGLEGAERGETMISVDPLNDTFQTGESIEPGRIKAADQESILASARLEAHGYASDGADFRMPNGQMPGQMKRSMTESQVTIKNVNSQLERQNTLISASSNPARRSKELNRLLANSNRKLTSSASSSAGESIASMSTDSIASTRSLSRSNAVGQSAMPPAVLEQGRSGKSRVDVDLVLERDLIVEGGNLTGRLEIKVRKSSDKDGALMLTQPKVRVVGFEELLNDDTRHIFYHHATVIDGSPSVGKGPSQPYVLHGTPSLSPEADNRTPLACFASQADSEGYCLAKDGSHSIPFALELPVGKGAKGSYRGKHAIVRYIVIGSVKLKSANGANRSIAHFYRHVDLYPYLNPAVILSSASKPVQARASKGLFLGGNGKVNLYASLHRSTWVAGQRVYVNIRIDNETNKKVKSLTLALVRTVTLYRPRPEFDMQISAPDDPSETYVDPDACTTSTSRKKITEEVLEMGQKGAKGLVTARGWWTGVEGGDSVELSHNMNLPVDALTVSRGRHVEVLYSIKVSISSSLSSDVSVELPVRVINFVSLDPPPLQSSSAKVTRDWSRDNHQRNAMSDSEAPMVARMRTMEALRSPGRFNTGLGDAMKQQEQQQQGQQAHQSLQPPPQTAGSNQLQVPDANNARRLQHQKSLDFINHAIRSATARRGGQPPSNEPSPTGLGIGLDDNRTPPADYSNGAPGSVVGSEVSSAVGPIHPSCAPYEHNSGSGQPSRSRQGLYQHPVNMPMTAVSLDDLGDEDDSDDDLGVGNQTLNLNDESVDEVDFVIGSARMDGGESSPEFQQRREFAGSDEPEDRLDEVEEEADSSTSTVTSIAGIREEDEYDEEEERMDRRRTAESQGGAQREVGENADEEQTPLAHSPPKFQSTGPTNRLATLPKTKPSIPRLRARVEDSEEEYSSSSTSSSARRPVVRTGSDLEARLGRSSTIIRGPSSNPSRPVSPSKQAPSPTKSALKSKSSFTFATNQNPLKARASQPQQQTAPSKPAMIPLTLKAKVDARDVPRAAPRGMAPQKQHKQQPQPQPQQQQQRTARPAERPVAQGRKSEDKNRSAPAGGFDDESNASTSPASSASVATPEMAAQEGVVVGGGGSHQGSNDDDEAEMGLRLQLIDATPKKRMGKADEVREVESAMTASNSAPSLARSSSTHNLRGSNVCVPSVRDKIAMLESRKQALKNFTASSPSPSSSQANTPTRSNVQPAQAGGAKPDTPSRVQAATRQLERNNSMISDVSSHADYLKGTPSLLSFKAPLLNAP